MISSCSMLGGPDGYFPDKKYDFLKEEIEDTISLPDELDSPNIENHYPVTEILEIDTSCIDFKTVSYTHLRAHETQ